MTDTHDDARSGPTSAEPGAVTLAEIASQPDMWRRAQALVRTTSTLPAAGEPVLFLGCGTSYYVGESYARTRVAAGQGRTRAAVPSELPYVDDDETVVVLSRSGTTRDVVQAARELSATHRVIGLIGTPGTELERYCADVIDLSFADETSIVQTRFATTALTLLRASVLPGEDTVIKDAEEALLRPVPDPLPRHVVFLGTGASLGMAHEAALKCLEASGIWAEAYAALEYQHGPISAAGPGTLVWPLVPVSAEVVDPILATGADVVTPELDPLAEVVAVHRMAVALALAAGRDPDVPPHLSRSVV